MLKVLPYQVYSLSNDGIKLDWSRHRTENHAFQVMARLAEKYPHAAFDVEILD
jgi:hypothetical protein|tara:strand:+ start:331 stop:489 length:159 start_codon:yes stop_codon:yes gene_type:complete